MSSSNYRNLKEQISKLQLNNESLNKEISDLKVSYSVNQEKLREFLNKLEINDRELITSLTENKRLSRFNQDLQHENLLLTKNLKEIENRNRDFYAEISEKNNIINHLQEQISLHSNQNESFKSKTHHLESQIDLSEEILHQLKQNQQELLSITNNFQQQIENSIKTITNFFNRLDPSLKIMLKNPQKSLEFVVKTQDFLASKHKENPQTLMKFFQSSQELILEGFEESLNELHKEMENSAKESQKTENIDRELKRMKREELFSKDQEKENNREIENLKQSKSILEKDKEKTVNELNRLKKENELVLLEIQQLKSEFEKAKMNLEKYQKANDKLLNFSEERVQTHHKLLNTSQFLDNFFYKILEFIPNEEIVKIIKEIFILEGEINKLNTNKSLLEKKLSEFELDYKSKLSMKNGSDPELLDIRRTIDKKREEFQSLLSLIRESNFKKTQLIDELDLNAKIYIRTKSPRNNNTNMNKSFEVKAKSIIRDNSIKKTYEIENNEKGLYISHGHDPFQSTEKSSSYDKFKQMKKTVVNEKNILPSLSQTTKAAISVVFSPTNESNVKLAKMMETDQKQLEEKFGQSRKI